MIILKLYNVVVIFFIYNVINLFGFYNKGKRGIGYRDRDVSDLCIFERCGFRNVI